LARLPGGEKHRHVGFNPVGIATYSIPTQALAFTSAPTAIAGLAPRERQERVQAMLDAVGLGDRGASPPRELSGGELQRVAVARALVHRPALVLADEPTGNLDPETSREIMDLLDRINRTGTTVLMATHDHHIVDSMRQRVVELSLGRLVRDEQRGVYGMDR
jgi:cell division transport system ATP-binding protein